MSEGMEELARRLVVGRKRDGRAVYDEQAKAELVAMCAAPGASVSRLARECGVNANQLSRWVRESAERRQCALVVATEPPAAAFMPVTLEVPPSSAEQRSLCLQGKRQPTALLTSKFRPPRRAATAGSPRATTAGCPSRRLPYAG